MKKNYIIWGISDTGYKESISSSFRNNNIPSEFKDSVSDKHRTVALYFSQENSHNDYFYSIERVRNNVLYTIYRTNWYRSNRLSYDAATIIIDKNQLMGDPLNSLRSLIKSYVDQKESGVGEYNFENIISQIILRSKQLNEIRPIAKKYKEGYRKYQSETDLSSFFSDSEKNLYNFNKVFFFTGLSYLEQGASKSQDLSDYKKITITLINYNVRNYLISLDGKRIDISGNSFESYEGEEIKITAKRGNMRQKVEIAKEGLTILLKKVAPPLTKKEKKKKRNKILLIIAICLLLILVVLGFIFKDNIFKKSKKNNTEKITEREEDTSTCQVIFEKGKFTSQDSVTIKDGEELLECFRNGWINIGGKKYKLIKDYIIKTEKEKDDWKIVQVKGLENLEKTLLQGNNDSKKVRKKIRETIREIINWKMLTSEVGLSGNRNTWQWKNHVLKNKLNSNPESDFKESTEFIKSKENVDNLIDFLSVKGGVNKPIPTSKLIKIKRYIYETTESDEVKDYLNNLEGNEEEEEEKLKGCKNKNYNEYNPDADIEDKSLCKTKKKCRKCKKDKDKCSGHSSGHSSKKCGVCKEKEEDCSCNICKDGVNLDQYPKCNQVAKKEIANQEKIEKKNQEISTAENSVNTQQDIYDNTEKTGAELDKEEEKLNNLKKELKQLRKDLISLERESECKKIQKWKSAFENCIKNNCGKGKQRYNNLKKAPCN